MSDAGLVQKLAAIFAADVAGYSRLMAADERATIAALDAARTALRSQIEGNGGRVIDMAGDSILAVFETANGAVSAARGAQEALEAAAGVLPEERRLRFRIGIHLGDVMQKADGTVYGDGVNVAARLQALAEPGGIAVSDAVEAAVRRRIAADFEDRGEHSVKNIAHPVRAFMLRAASRPAADPPSAGARAALLAPRKPTIAVLAFENMSADPEQEHFADGISEDIITDLSKISGLAVIGRQSSFAYKGKKTDLRRIATELGVRYVLEGSVRTAGGRVRVNAQLIEAEAGTHLWANRYDRELGDAFLIGDEIAEDIVTSLDVKLVHGEEARIWRKSIKSPAAREIFMRSLDSFFRPSLQNVRTARELLMQAIRLEPNAFAFGLLGFSYIMEVMYGWSSDVPASLAEADRHSRRALAMDDSVAGGHYVQGFLALFRGQHEQALEAAERALERRPMCAGPRAGLAYIEVYSGKPGSAIRHAEEAITLNPVFPGWYLYITAAAEFFSGRAEQALATLERALATSPGLVLAKILRVAVLSELGRSEESRAAAREIVAAEPELSLERLAATQPFRDAARRERYLATLREAGLFLR
jgi:adenylate cyclase